MRCTACENLRVKTPATQPSPPTATDIAAVNRGFYDDLWRGAKLQKPEKFNTWPLVASLLAQAPRRLEIGPGLRPRLPLAGTDFVEMSPPAVAALNARGGRAQAGDITALPHPDQAFDLVCACDILEHTADDRGALREISRVLAPGGTLILSVPLFMKCFNDFDAAVGHYRRYEPEELTARLAEAGFVIKQSAVYGMQPKSAWLLNLGLWWMRTHREQALRWYNRCFMPLSMLSQKPLKFHPGLLATEGVDEIVAVCRRA